MMNVLVVKLVKVEVVLIHVYLEIHVVHQLDVLLKITGVFALVPLEQQETHTHSVFQVSTGLVVLKYYKIY